MKIALSEIKGLDRRVRKQMSPEKLEELTESLRDLGQIVPVKVRKNGEGYTLVYGHRRVQAAKAAGFKEIDAVVEAVPDDKLLTFALAENVIREDMAAIDIAKALQAIIEETGATQGDLGKKLGWTEATIRNYLELLIPEIKKVMESNSSSNLPYRHVGAAKAAGDTKLAARVLERAGREDLSQRDTRKVAEVVRRANEFGGSKAVARVFAQPTRRILDTAETLPPRKTAPKAIARVVQGKIAFEWLKDPRRSLALDAVATVSSVVSAIARSPEDRGGGKAVLKEIRRALSNVLKQLDDILG